jgi:ATP-binding cassette subfamily B protein
MMLWTAGLPACLRMIAKYYGKVFSLKTLRERSFITREGVSMLGISDAAESIGFRTLGMRMGWVVENPLQDCNPLKAFFNENRKNRA